MKAAEKICKEMNDCRSVHFTADAAYEILINLTISEIISIRMAHREVFFKDGSWATVLDTTMANKEGISEYLYSLKYQDRLF